MVPISIWIYCSSFKMLKFAFEHLKPYWMVLICNQMLQILFELFKFAIEFFEFLSIGYNLHWNASNLVWRYRIWIPMLRIPFEWLEFAFECFESLWSCSKLRSNLFEWLGFTFEFLFEWLEFGFECFEFLFEWIEFEFKCFKSLLNGWNLHSISLNSFRMDTICI